MNCPRCGYYLENPNVAACPNCGQPLSASAGAYGGAPQNPNPYGQPPQGAPYGQPPTPYGQPAAPSQPMYPPAPGTYPPPNPQMYAPPSQPMYAQPPQGMPGMPPGGTPFQPPKRGMAPLVRVLIGVVVVVVVIAGIAFASGLLQGNSVYSSALTGNVSDWPSDGGCSPQSDGYHITAAVICYPDLAEQGDVTLSVQAKQISGESTVAYGVAFRRASKGNYYFFGVDGNGKWIVQKVVNDEGTRLVDFTANAAINSGLDQINTLKVAAKGAHFTFFANGAQLGSIDDSTFGSGKWGLAGEDGIEVVFTTIAITKTA